MSAYQEFINKVHSFKQILLEINKGLVMNKDQLWIKNSPNVWKTTYAWESGKSVNTTFYGVGTWGAGTYGKTSSAALPASQNPLLNQLGSLELDGDFYVLVNSEQACENTHDSFYWVQSTNVLYIHYHDYIMNPDIVIKIGISFGFSLVDRYYNDIFYEGKIKSIPSVSFSQDKLFKNIVNFDGGNVSIINTDGALNNFGNADVFGQVVTLLFGGDDLPYSEYEKIYTGFLQTFNYITNDLILALKDDRKNMKRKIPLNVLDTETYPDLKPGLIGNVIPIGYGKCNRGLSICTNDEETTPVNYNFIFIDTSLHDIQSIDKVYVDSVEVSFTSGSTSAGTFDLSTSDYKPGQKVSCDYYGYIDDSLVLIDNPMDIIVDLLLIYLDKVYSSDFYNITEWEAARTGLPPIGLCISKQKQLIDIIGQITNSILGTFTIQGNGLYTMKLVDLTKTPLKTVKHDEVLGLVKIKNNEKNYLSSCGIQYDRLWEDDQFNLYINDSREKQYFDNFRSYFQQDFKTLLTTESDAIDYSENILDLFGGITKDYSFDTKTQNIFLELEDIIYLESETTRGGGIETVKLEIIQGSVDYNSMQVSFTGRKIG